MPNHHHHHHVGRQCHTLDMCGQLNDLIVRVVSLHNGSVSELLQLPNRINSAKDLYFVTCGASKAFVALLCMFAMSIGRCGFLAIPLLPLSRF